VHGILEDHRTAVRNVRRTGNDSLKKMLKDKTISEDDEKKALDDIQKLTDDFIHKLEDVAKHKEQEIMKV
jgi:ribosome recycling factor